MKKDINSCKLKQKKESAKELGEHKLLARIAEQKQDREFWLSSGRKGLG